MKKVILSLFVVYCFTLNLSSSYAQSCSGSLGNPIVDVNFGTGTNPGAALATGSTNYTYSNSDCPNDGSYTIRNSTGSPGNGCFGNSWFYLAEDHTPGDVNGYMMVINAANAPGEFFKQTVTGLCTGTTYELSSWVINLLTTGACTSNPNRFPNITFQVETTTGTVIKTYNTGNIVAGSTAAWVRQATFFTMPAGQNSVVLKLINNAPGGCGNDLAIDDIQFRACGPVLTASISGNMAV